jgi:phosphoribosylformylglycinamidine cyclo-ligase
MPKKRPLTYADAGVNVDLWNKARSRVGELVSSTYNKHVLGKFGQFGGMFSIGHLKEYKKPVLVSSVDGVGTKLKIAVEMGIHSTVGQDLVNHCVNDILVLGARPLFFLDYIGTGKLSREVLEKIVEGFAVACKAENCVLIGGETAEMPGMYAPGEYDLAGTIVGVVDEKEIIDGSAIKAGDVLIGLRSNGLHTNGYSLARKIVSDAARASYRDVFQATGRTLGEELLRPHRAYSPVLALMKNKLIRGCAHITGGGFHDNVDRILPSTCDAVIDAKTWKPDAIFAWLQEKGGVETDEMYHTFNMSIGMVLAVKPSDRNVVLSAPEIKAFDPKAIGAVAKGSGIVRMEY